MSEQIGFIGMGIMGSRMARNLLKAGHPVTVYNRSRDKAAPLAEAGATVADTPAEAADGADVVILMLTGPEACDAAVQGDNGILRAANPPATVVNMSTVPREYSEGLNETVTGAGIGFLEAPVSGSKKPAEDAQLVILAGGPADSVQSLEPVLLKMGKKVIHCGPVGQGAAMKLTINLLLGTMMEGLCEAVNFGTRSGLAPELILSTILAGPLGCGFFGLKEGPLKSDDYPPQFPLQHMLKDLRFAMDAARQNGAAVPAGAAVTQTFKAGLEMGLGELDLAAVMRVIQSRSG